MKRFILILLCILNFSSCNNEERESRKRGQEQFIGSLIIGGLIFRPNYCEPSQLLLEEGQTYNITLEAGKRFWFDYGFRSQGDNRNHRLTIKKSISDEIGYQIKDCRVSNDLGERKIVSSTPIQIVYESESFSYTTTSSSNATDTGFFLESKNGNTIISISFIQI